MHARIVGRIVCEMKMTGMVAIETSSLIKAIGAFMLTRVSMTWNGSTEGDRQSPGAKKQKLDGVVIAGDSFVHSNKTDEVGEG